MRRIKFDIKYKDLINKGQYSLENRIGDSIQILKWDADGEYPFIALVNNKSVKLYDVDGTMLDGGIDDHLWVVTDEPEPIFKIGDVIRVKPMEVNGRLIVGNPAKIVGITDEGYVCDDGQTYAISLQSGWELYEETPQDKFHKELMRFVDEDAYNYSIREYESRADKGELKEVVDAEYIVLIHLAREVFANELGKELENMATGCDGSDVPSEKYQNVHVGHWYMCTNDQYSFDGKQLLNKEGKVYRCVHGYYIENEFGNVNLYSPNHFRPAKGDEIGPNFCVGDVVRKIGSSTEYTIAAIYNDGGLYVFNFGQKCPHINIPYTERNEWEIVKCGLSQFQKELFETYKKYACMTDTFNDNDLMDMVREDSFKLLKAAQDV